MVYISGDGTLCQNQPWGFRKVFGIFYGVVSGVFLFFQSLVGLSPNRQHSQDYRVGGSAGTAGSRGGGFGYGGGSGGGSGGGGGPRIRTMRDVNPPTVNAGGCPGGSCGM